MTLTLGSLFTGTGALDQAAANVLGCEPAWFCDNDPAASALLAHHHPDTPNLGDITAVDWSTVEPVDIIGGGFPCQDVSAAGRRVGLAPGTRSGLWSHMAYAISRIRPRLVIVENVRGILSATAHSDVEPCPGCMGGTTKEPPMRALGAVLGDLADLGYDAVWCGLRAADVGAPHGRYRIFLIAADTRGETLGLGTGLRPRRPDRVGRGRPDDRAVSATTDPEHRPESERTWAAGWRERRRAPPGGGRATPPRAAPGRGGGRVTNLQPELTGETIATLILVPILLALVIAFGSVLFVMWRRLRIEALDDIDADFARLALAGWILCAVAFVLIGVGTWWGMYPWRAEYHQWRPVDGTVDTVNSRLMSSGDKTMEDKYVVTFVGSEEQYGVLDTRAAGLRPGDHLAITCVRRWQWSGTPGHDCNFVSLERAR